jgi:hypothetical protein
VQRPDWLDEEPNDGLNLLFEHMDSVWSDGIVVWGHIIQANVLMYEDNDPECPGELVVVLDRDPHIKLEDLLDIAYEIGSLKDDEQEHDDLALRFIGNYLRDERIRLFGHLVPDCLSPRNHARISTTFFVRKHLPKGRLCCGLLPVLVLPREPYFAMTLPERYWPKDFIDFWVSRRPNPKPSIGPDPTTIAKAVRGLLISCCARTGRDDEHTLWRIQEILNRMNATPTPDTRLRESLIAHTERRMPLAMWMAGPILSASKQQRQLIYKGAKWLFEGTRTIDDVDVLHELATALRIEND